MEGIPKLLDFGIAKLLTSYGAGSETVTREGMLTPEFASPEQMRGQSVDEAADIYALGVLLYRLLAVAIDFDPKAAKLKRSSYALSSHSNVASFARRPV